MTPAELDEVLAVARRGLAATVRAALLPGGGGWLYGMLKERLEHDLRGRFAPPAGPHGLVVALENGEVAIRLPLEALRRVVEAHPALWDAELAATGAVGDNNGEPVVHDIRAFAEDLLRHALRAEREDGSTVVTDMFDRAVVEALGQGARGVQLPGKPYDPEVDGRDV